MQFVVSTPIVFAACLLFLLRGPVKGLFVVFALMPLGMMALVNLPAVGGMSVIAVDVAVLLACAMLVFKTGFYNDLARVYGPNTPGAFFLLFLLLGAVSAIFFPRLFAGATEVFGIARIEGARGIVSRPLSPSTGNLSQLFRLTLSTLSFGALAIIALNRPDPRLLLNVMKAATLVHLAMGVLDIVTQSLNLTYLLDWARTANYALTLGQELAGVNRVIGGFPEASSFGYFSLGLFGFWFCFWLVQGRTDWTAAFYCVAVFAILLRTTSSSAYVGLFLFFVVFLIYRFVSISQPRVSARGAFLMLCMLVSVPLLAMGLYTLYEVNSGFAAFIDRSLLSKLSSDSGVERMSWNRQALTNFAETWYLGAGIGSVRASNWAAAVLATTGLLGAVLIAIALFRLFAQSLSGLPRETRNLGLSLKFCCVGFLCRGLVVKASPDLGIAFCAVAGLVTGLALYARSARHARRRMPDGPVGFALS